MDAVRLFAKHVLWLLAALLIVALFGVRSWRFENGSARKAAAMAQIHSFQVSLNAFQGDTGTYPSEVQGLEALWSDPGVDGWNGPYILKMVPTDPWGERYTYSLVDGRPRIVSLGSGTDIASDGFAGASLRQ